MTYCSNKIIVLIWSQFPSSHVSHAQPGAEARTFVFQIFHSFRCVLQAVACSCFFSHLTGLISNLFHRITCLEGIHGPTFMEFVGKFQVCIYLKLYVKAYWTTVILALFCVGFVLPFCHSISQDTLGIGSGGGSPSPKGHVAPLPIPSGCLKRTKEESNDCKLVQKQKNQEPRSGGFASETWEVDYILKCLQGLFVESRIFV